MGCQSSSWSVVGSRGINSGSFPRERMWFWVHGQTGRQFPHPAFFTGFWSQTCSSAHHVLVIEKQFLQLPSLQQLQDKAFLGQPEGSSWFFLQEVQYAVMWKTAWNQNETEIWFVIVCSFWRSNGSHHHYLGFKWALCCSMTLLLLTSLLEVSPSNFLRTSLCDCEMVQ